MTNIIMTGCSGKMGCSIIAAADSRDDVRICAGVDLAEPKNVDFIYAPSFSELQCEADVIVDFSNPVVLESMLAYAEEHKLPVVICTTGYSEEQKKRIHEASKNIPIFYSGNMSLGINLIIELAKRAAAVFGEGFDIEIIEQHHNQKLDAPSGTALLLAQSIAEVRENAVFNEGRSGHAKRTPEEIGIHAIRIGNEVGTHEILISNGNETITLKHEAENRALFAQGALKAASFMEGKEPGFYNMDNMV